MSKSNKKIQAFIFLIKILLFLTVIWLFFNQIFSIDWKVNEDISIQDPFLFIIVILLIAVNWGIEFLKWEVILKVSKVRSSLQNNIKSFLAGILTGFLTPNMIGNFLGRMFYFQRRERPAIILLTLFSNAAQFLGSIFFGFIAIYWLGIPHHLTVPHQDIYIVLAGIFILGLLLLYFKFEKINIRWIQQNKYAVKVIPLIQNATFFRLKLLSLSFARHFVFSIQYWLLLKTLGQEINLEWLGWIWQVFFWATIVPSLWLGKIVIRESIALLILAPLTSNPPLILVASVGLWCLNQAIPAMIGIPFLTKKSTSI